MARGRSVIVDAMSSFGAVPLELGAAGIDWVVSSANKCIEGVPGFSFALARRSALEVTAGNARSLSLDLHAQWKGLEANGQFRFTPPTHTLLAFRQALDELDAEGGVEARYRRYKENHRVLVEGLEGLGFQPLVKAEYRSPIITSFLYPQAASFSFEQLYDALKRRRFVIYPGKVSQAPTFRVGTIGHVFPDDFRELTRAFAAATQELGLQLRPAGTF